MKVLFADDAPVSRQLVTNILVRPGIELVTVSDGEEAWQALQKPDPPRLLLLDWMMPKMDGIELCQKIRGSDWPRYTYIILLTGRTQPADVVAAVDSGIDDFLGKPFAHDDLLARIRIGERALQKEDRLSQIAAGLAGHAGKDSRGSHRFTSQRGDSTQYQGVSEVLGYANPKDLLNRKLDDLLSPGQLNSKGFIQIIRTAGSTDPVEVTMLARDKSPVEVLLWGRLALHPHRADVPDHRLSPRHAAAGKEKEER